MLVHTMTRETEIERVGSSPNANALIRDPAEVAMPSCHL